MFGPLFAVERTTIAVRLSSGPGEGFNPGENPRIRDPMTQPLSTSCAPKHPATGRRTAAVLALAALLTGCTSGHTFILSRPAARRSYPAVALREGASTATLDPEFKDYFLKQLRSELAEKPALAISDESPALTLEYRMVTYDKGVAAARVVNGVIQLAGVPVSGMGDGTVGIEVLYKDRSGAVVAQIVADGPIRGPLGSTKGGLDMAAENIAAFTKQQFQATESPMAEASRE